MKTRRAVFAGSWYPGSAGECEREIQKFINTDDFTAEIDFTPVGSFPTPAGIIPVKLRAT